MSAVPQASLSFLPWVRQGAAAAITTPDTLGPKQAGVADVSVTLKVNNDAPLPATSVRLRGPADVVGIDANQILRTDPRPGSNDFESNCFPSIEFDRADFPWLFTPACANANTQLRPWLCLVVVRKQEGVQLTSTVDAPLTTLRIAPPAIPFNELPNLLESWAWAHAQAAALDNSSPEVRKALNGAPRLSLSRLVCPRILAHDTDYIACVVPTFELGRKAGLGLATSDNDLLAPSWALTATSPPTLVQLPVYYRWEFRTGPGGDFESLGRSLTSSVPQGLGQRTVDIRHPGFVLPAGFPASATAKVEGALQPLTGSTSPVLWSDATAAPAEKALADMFEKALADIVNQPGLSQVATPAADPLLAPPLYGRWYAARATVTPGAANWFDELNLDPRWRVAAAIGTRVVQQHQEALMASAWEQAAEMPHVNQRMRQLQLSMAVGESLHARHLSTIDSEERMLRIAAPAFSRIREPSSGSLGRTLTAMMMASSLPVPATRTAMRRIGRQRGPLTRRIAAQGVVVDGHLFVRSPDKTWVARLNLGDAPPPVPPPTFDYANLHGLPSVQDVVTAIWNYGFQVAAEGQPLAPLPAVDLLPGDWDYPGFFRSAAHEHLLRIRRRRPPLSHRMSHRM